MGLTDTVTTSVVQPQRTTARDGLLDAVKSGRTIGYRALLLLAFLLPFDMERRPLLWTNYLSITNLTVALLVISALALITNLAFVREAFRGSSSAALYFSQRRVPLALIVAFLISCTISTVTAHHSTQGASWFLGIFTGALLWLALPLWLAENTASRINRLGMTFVAGAIVASVIGFIEVAVGPVFDQNLLLFKFGPDIVGPWLRLSATFSSANVAAMYFELALPCAVAGLMVALGRTSRRWVQVAAWLIAIDVLLVAVILTYSRGALLGLLTAAVVMALAARRVWGRRMAIPWRGLTIAVANLAVVCGAIAISSSSNELLRFSTENDRSWYQASYTGTVPATLLAGKTRMIPVTVENQSPLLWNASSPHTYGLSYHWLYPSRKVEQFANNITWLSSDVPPGTRRTVHERVVAPSAPGKYLLLWDMVWMGTTWFGPRTGTYQTSTVRVIGPSAPTGGAGSIPPDITYLPTAPALDRRQIWTAALKMIKAHPLFGVGSQGVRMNYVAFAPFTPADRASKPPPHAHNLALEMVADWGIIGGGIFAAMLIALWWPLLQGIWRGTVASAWELAVIGAIAALLGHELVDYFLTKQAVFVILWILCGLAAVNTGRVNNSDYAGATYHTE